MSALGMRSPRLSTNHVRSFRIAATLIVMLALLATERRSIAAVPTHKARKHAGHSVMRRKTAHSTKAHKRLRRHIAKKSEKTRPTQHARRLQRSLHAPTHVALPAAVTGKPAARAAVLASSKGKRHRARKPVKHRSRVRLAARPRDPGKLVIPEGDGPPILSVAARFLGRPYRFGGDGGAFDCSGFVRTVFAKVGVDLPHSAREQFAMGDRVRRDDLEPGDLVFFHTNRRFPTHVGIYVGDDRFVHAARHGGQVQVDSLNASYYAQHYLGARRLET